MSFGSGSCLKLRADQILGSGKGVLAGLFPAGVWSVTLINVAGQTWTVPNALWTLPSVSESFDPNSQRGALILE